MSRLSSLNLGLFCVLISSCQGGVIEGVVGPSRTIDKPAPNLTASSAERFGFRPQVTSPVAPVDRPRLFVFDLPEAWSELPATQFRLINLKVPGEVQCWISTARGSLDANLNRWRGQLGLAPWSPAEIEALPRKTMLELPAVYVELTGDSKGGMGAEPIIGAKLLGLVAELPSGVSVFVKMLGPGPAVDRQVENFDKLRLSLAPAEIEAQPGGEDGSQMVAQPSIGDAAGGLVWQMPEAWSQTAPRSMRVVTFRPHANPQTECWISSWAGEVGGVMANITRWRAQVGMAPLTTNQVAALPKISVLGGEAMILDALPSGEGGQALLALLSYVDGQSTFVKMIGPKNEVEAEREHFMDLCRSLRRSN